MHKKREYFLFHCYGELIYPYCAGMALERCFTAHYQRSKCKIKILITLRYTSLFIHRKNALKVLKRSEM